MDVTGFTGACAEQRQLARSTLGTMLDKALKGISDASRTRIDSAECVCVCFFDDPEDALQSALLLRGLLVQKYGKALSVRIGLHLGPVRLVLCAGDFSSKVTALGDGINVARRIVDFAQPNQIVASQIYHDVVCGITDHDTRMFNHLGTHLDKHLRSHDLFAVLEPRSVAAKANAVDHAFDNMATFPDLVSLTVEMAAEIEHELALLIGPLATILVKKATPRAPSPRALRELLSATIADLPTRAAFVAASTAASRYQHEQRGARPP
jgi:hypothetical protein